MTTEKRSRTLPGTYAIFFQILADRARELGYALAVHGSLARDLDLVAIPWTEHAVEAHELAHALAERLGGAIDNDPNADPHDFTKRNPQPKPHGRLAFSIALGGGPFVDLSVMPREVAP